MLWYRFVPKETLSPQLIWARLSFKFHCWIAPKIQVNLQSKLFSITNQQVLTFAFLSGFSTCLLDWWVRTMTEVVFGQLKDITKSRIIYASRNAVERQQYRTGEKQVFVILHSVNCTGTKASNQCNLKFNWWNIYLCIGQSYYWHS